jgi:hypothetical protein
MEFDNNGEPAAGHYLFVYEAGTSTKTTTYSKADLTVVNSNPIELDSAGRATVYLVPGTYKFVLALPTDTDPPTSPIWTQDEVPSLSPFATNLDLLGVAGETITGNDVVYLSGSEGGHTPGRWYKTDADQTYSSSGATTVGIAVSTASVGGDFAIRKNGRVTGLSGLVAGSVYYASSTAGGLTATAPTNAIVIGKADSTTSIVLGASWGDASATGSGVVTATAQTFGGVKTFNVQPLTYIGGATTLPATMGGVWFTDVTAHAVIASQTDSVMSTTSLPANMLNADGKAIIVRFGSSTATTGAGQKKIEIDFGGAQVIVRDATTNATSWWIEAVIIRIDSDSVDLAAITAEPSISTNGSGARINGIDFTAAIVLRTLGTTGAASTLTQTYCTVEAIG